MFTGCPIRVADGYVFEDDTRTQGFFQTDGAVDLKRPIKDGTGSGFQLIPINGRIHKNQGRNSGNHK